MSHLDSPRVLTAGLARHVVSEIAPEELPSFDLMARPYLAGVSDTWTGKPDEPLEFGVVEAVAVVTPVVTLVCASVVNALLRGVEGELERTSGTATRRLLDRLLRRAPAEPEPAPWTPEHLTRAHDVAVSRALALGVEPETARAIADSVVAALALERR